ncbi:UNVERIFIED_CONTAM: Zn-dependent alcohol dehydrogenase [Streptomyces canus]
MVAETRIHPADSSSASPALIDLYLGGRFDLDAFVSETIGLGDVEKAFEKMHRGEVLRSVVVL